MIALYRDGRQAEALEAFGRLRRESVPAEAAGNPTVRLYLLGDLRSAGPAFQDAAVAARARGELAREVHCRASIARARAALGELEAVRAALAEARELASRIPGRGWSWERIHVVGALDALTLATAENWEGVLAAFDRHLRRPGDLVTLADQGKVALHSSRYPLAAANDAIDDLRHGRIRGRAVLISG